MITGQPILVGGGSPTITNLEAGNIKRGTTIKVGTPNSLGKYAEVTGTFEGYIPSTGEIYRYGSWGSGWSTSDVTLQGYYNGETFRPSITYNQESMRLTGGRYVLQSIYPSTFYGMLLFNKTVSLNTTSRVNISFLNPSSASVFLIVSKPNPGSNRTYYVVGNSTYIYEINGTEIWRNGSVVDGYSNAMYPSVATSLSLGPISPIDAYIGIGVAAHSSIYIDIQRIWLT